MIKKRVRPFRRIIPENFIGKGYGVLKIVHVFSNPVHRKFLCVCDCGKKITIRADKVISGKVKTCICLFSGRIKIRHGFSGIQEYPAWIGMRSRCLNKNNKDYKYYGGRGIRICKRWEKSFKNFLTDMGKRPNNLTIERINNNLGYNKRNCRWATMAEQNKNKRLKFLKNKTV